MKKRKIINIILIVSFAIGIFFLIRYDVIGRLYDVMSCQVAQNKSQSKSDTQRELKYETVLDEDGNEIVIEMEKIIVEDEEGNEVEMYVDIPKVTPIVKTKYRPGYSYTFILETIRSLLKYISAGGEYPRLECSLSLL